MAITTRFEVNMRVRHAKEPDMYGTVLSWTAFTGDTERYLVRWDGGEIQWMESVELKHRGSV